MMDPVTLALLGTATQLAVRGNRDATYLVGATVAPNRMITPVCGG